MPITCEERALSGKITTGDSPADEKLYVIQGADSETAAMTVLEITAPTATGSGLVRQSCSVEPQGNDIWYGTVQYGPAKSPETGESAFTFDTTGGTQHITQSKGTVGRYGLAGDAPPDLGGAVGVSHDSVDGCDITIPLYAFSETHYLADTAVTDAYKGKLFYLTGRTNNATFKGCAAGECLFLGATGSKRGKGDWEITFKFAASPNMTNIDIGPGRITVASKKGWEYLWIRYRDAVANSAGGKPHFVQVPYAAYVEKVYDEGNFAELGIGA